MVDFVRIALLDTCQRCFRERALDAHHCRSTGLRCLRRFAEERQHFGDMRQISLPCLDGFGIVLHVVVAIWQPDAIRSDACDDLGGIPRILLYLNSEKQPSTTRAEM